MYNIISETDYSEQLLPATPPRLKEPSPPIVARPISARAIIDAPPAQHRAAQQGQAQGTSYAADRLLISSRAGDRRALFRQSSSPQVAVHASSPTLSLPMQFHSMLKPVCSVDKSLHIASLMLCSESELAGAQHGSAFS